MSGGREGEEGGWERREGGVREVKRANKLKGEVDV